MDPGFLREGGNKLEKGQVPPPPLNPPMVRDLDVPWCLKVGFERCLVQKNK